MFNVYWYYWKNHNKDKYRHGRVDSMLCTRVLGIISGVSMFVLQIIHKYSFESIGR